MRLHRAWLQQAASDRSAAITLHETNADRCQVVAKCQQACEKAIKGFVEATTTAWQHTLQVDSSHAVSHHAAALLRLALARPKTERKLKAELQRVLSPQRIDAIKVLDSVVP